MTRIALFVACLVIASGTLAPLAIVDANAQEDEWPETCRDAPVVEPGQTFQGAIVSPDDSDALRFDLSKGDYLSVSPVAAEEAQTPKIHVGGYSSVKAIEDIEDTYGSTNLRLIPGQPGSFEVWAESDNIFCLRISDIDGEEADVPYQWRITVTKNTPSPSPIAADAEVVADLRDEVEEKEDRIEELEDENEQLRQEINDLENELEEKDERIAELEEERGDVTINVEVMPEGDQQDFVAGGALSVSAESESADFDQFSIEFNGEEIDHQDGDATIQLAEPGQHTLVFSYSQTSVIETIDVVESQEMEEQETGEEQEQETGEEEGDENEQEEEETGEEKEQNEQETEEEEETEQEQEDDDGPTDEPGEVQEEDDNTPADDNDGTDPDQPGFGVFVALLAILASLLLKIR